MGHEHLALKRKAVGYSLLGVPLLTVLVGVLALISHNQEARAAAYSRAVVESFGTALITYKDYYGRFPAVKEGEMFRVLQGEDLRGQNASNLIFFAASPGKTPPWVLDGWERPIYTVVNSNVVRVWSSGPNGKDERGGGDDIVVEKK